MTYGIAHLKKECDALKNEWQIFLDAKLKGK
jgi:hypothetical protein